MKGSNETVDAPASREMAVILLRAALSKKAFSPVLIKLAGLTSLTDYFLIVSARSGRQVAAVAEALEAAAKERHFRRPSVEGLPQGNWVLLDFGDLVVHVFQPGPREFYDLEGLWREAYRESFSLEIAQEIAAAEAEAQTDQDDDDDW
jgi:ribosome silencing factor RsfS/YbeB/iojap